MNKAQFFNFMKSKNRVPDDNDYFAYQFGLTRGGNRLTTKEKIALNRKKLVDQINKASQGKSTNTQATTGKTSGNTTQLPPGVKSFEQYAAERMVSWRSTTKHDYEQYLASKGITQHSETNKHNHIINKNNQGGKGLAGGGIHTDIHNKVIGKKFHDEKKSTEAPVTPEPTPVIREDPSVSDKFNTPEYRDILEKWDYTNFQRKQQGLEPLPKPPPPAEKPAQNVQVLGSQNAPQAQILTPGAPPAQTPPIKQRMQVSATDGSKDPSQIIVGQQPPQGNRRMIVTG